MAERLTQSAPSSTPRWSGFAPALLLGAALLFWLLLPAATPEAVESGSRLYTGLLGLFQGRVQILQALAATLLAGAAMSMARPLLPPKSPKPAIASAQSLILLALVIPLHPWFADSLAGSAVTLSLAGMLGSWSLALIALRADRRHLLGLAGLLSGISISLSFMGVSGLLPLGILLLLHTRKTGRAGFAGLGLFALGLIIGLLPELQTLPERLGGLREFDAAHPLLSLRNTYTGLGIAGLLFLTLALLVGLLQKQSVILGLMLPCWLLQKLLLGFSGTPARLLGAALLIPALLYGYGIFRIVRGLETGLQAVSATYAKAVMRVTPVLLLLLFSFWAWRQFA